MICLETFENDTLIKVTQREKVTILWDKKGYFVTISRI